MTALGCRAIEQEALKLIWARSGRQPIAAFAKCEPGMASAIAVEIDRAAIPEIVGTLAGEDTIFIAVTERKAQRTAMKKIWELLG